MTRTVKVGLIQAANPINDPDASIAEIQAADVVVIVTDHTAYRYPEIVEAARLVVDTRNATKGIMSGKILKL